MTSGYKYNFNSLRFLNSGNLGTKEISKQLNQEIRPHSHTHTHNGVIYEL